MVSSHVVAANFRADARDACKSIGLGLRKSREEFD